MNIKDITININITIPVGAVIALGIATSYYLGY